MGSIPLDGGGTEPNISPRSSAGGPSTEPDTSRPLTEKTAVMDTDRDTAANGSYNTNEEGATSDVSMASGSDSDSDGASNHESPVSQPAPDHQPALPLARSPQEKLHKTSKKRKSPGKVSPESSLGGLSTPEPHKKARLDLDLTESQVSDSHAQNNSQLPLQVWQRIFTFCPPKTLGNLLRVNKEFHRALHPSSHPHNGHLPPPEGVLPTLEPSNIWRASRSLFWPHMPSPLRSMTELDMWKLLCLNKCQDCDKVEGHDPSVPVDNVHNGPGTGGVSVIWPFAIRVCGSCLLKKAIKEIDLLLSFTASSTLIPALPFVHITKELHVVSYSTIEQDQLPPGVQVTKAFLKSDVDELKQEFFGVKELGTGALEEWFKGLESRGQAHLNESRKWESWATPATLEQVRKAPVPLPLNRDVAVAAARTETGLSNPKNVQTRQERTVQEVAELRASRKAEIERRAALLAPPLTPNLLRHMQSFQAAMQLATPMDDKAWEILKPRLLDDREDAAKVEDELAAALRMIQEQNHNSQLEPTLATTRSAKEVLDKHWNDVQAPVRQKICGYADEIIKKKWDGGKKVTKANCSRFAAETLFTIRNRFYAGVAEEIEAAKAAGRKLVEDHPDGPFTQKLTLENMRWLFDYKIKPCCVVSEKELFYCNECATGPKALESIIQHYASTHTDRFKVDRATVNWRKEWPDTSPFNPEGCEKILPSGSGSTSHRPGPARGGRLPPYSYQPQPLPTIPSLGQPFAPPPYPGPAYAESYGTPYPAYQPPGPPGSYPPPQPYGPPPAWGTYGPYPNAPAPNGIYPQPPPQTQGPGYQSAPPIPGPAPYPTAPNPYNYGVAGGYQVNGVTGYAPPLPAPELQPGDPQLLQDIARNSRELWDITGSIRELDGSVRVIVVIHHVVKRYRARFSTSPPLTLFQKGLNEHKDMRPVRNINKLLCRACQLGLGNSAHVEEDKTSFSLPQLVNHFQSKHIEPMQRMAPSSPPLDWSVDMVMLPDRRVMDLVCSVINPSDRFRYNLFLEALPEIFGPSANSYHGQQQQQQQHYAPIQEELQPTGGFQYPPADSRNSPYAQQHQGPGDQAHGYHPPPAPQDTYQQTGYPQPPEANSYPPAPAQPPIYHPQQAPPNPALTSVADHEASRRGENGSRSSQDSRPSREQSGHQNQKKGSKKNKDRRNKPGPEAPSRSRKDEEPKMLEEEKARQEEIRKMWAADRADTARATSSSSAKPEADRQGQVTHKLNPGQQQQHPNSHAAQVVPNLLDVLEMSLGQDQGPTSQHQGPPPRDQANVIYMGDARPLAPSAPPVPLPRREDMPDEYNPRAPQYDSHNGPNARPPAPHDPYERSARPAEYTRERAPDYRQPDPAYYPPHLRDGPDEYRYESTQDPAANPNPRRYPPAVLQPDTYDRGYRHEEQIIYERAPLPQDHYRRSNFGPRVAPPVEEEFETVEVVDQNGVFLRYERHPIRRAPPPEPARGYYEYPPSQAERVSLLRSRPHADHVNNPVDFGVVPGHYRASLESDPALYSRAPPPAREEYALPRGGEYTRGAFGPAPPQGQRHGGYEEEYDPRFPGGAR